MTDALECLAVIDDGFRADRLVSSLPLPSGLTYGSSQIRSNLRPTSKEANSEALHATTSREGIKYTDPPSAHSLTFRIRRLEPISSQRRTQCIGTAGLERIRHRGGGSRVAERSPGPAHGRVRGSRRSRCRRSRRAARCGRATGAFRALLHDGGRVERPHSTACGGPRRTP